MTATEVQDVARRLMDARGDRALLEAKRRAADCMKTGREVVAADWKRVAEAISMLRGPRLT